MTSRDLARLAGVHPDLAAPLARVLAQLAADGVPMFVVEGVRTLARQAALYAQGRTAPGPIVTYKDGVRHTSHHQPKADGFGYAVDCAFVPTAATPDPFDRRWPWARYGELLEAEGLVWGGRWRMADLPHAELLATGAVKIA